MATKADFQAALKAAFVAVPGLVADSDDLDKLMSGLADGLWPYLSMVANAGVYITPEGGVAKLLINGTGTTSVKGSVVSISTTDDGEFILQANENDSMGVVYEDGISDGAACWIVFAGSADVLFKDGVTPTRGYWVYSADTDGRADNASAPPGGTITALENHMKEIGHCQESKSSGTDVIARCSIHFN